MRHSQALMRQGFGMTNAELGPAQADGVDLGSIGQALWRRKHWIVVPALLVAVLATVAVNLLTPRYKSEARVLFEGRENVFLRPEADKTISDQSASDQEAIANQVQIVLSREVALGVIKQLKLGDRPEFDPILGGISPLCTMCMTLSQILRSFCSDSSSVNLSRARPAFFLPLPWHS